MCASVGKHVILPFVCKLVKLSIYIVIAFPEPSSNCIFFDEGTYTLANVEVGLPKSKGCPKIDPVDGKI
jgi:hypothetical protein